MNFDFQIMTLISIIFFLGSFEEKLVGTSIPTIVIIALFIGFTWGISLKN